MRPLFRAGETVLLDPSALPGPGDVVVYRVEGRLLAHRLAFRWGGRAWAFDDAATVGWHRVDARSIVGRVATGRLFGSGLPGLAYGLLVFFAYTFRKLLKEVTFVTVPSP